MSVIPSHQVHTLFSLNILAHLNLLTIIRCKLDPYMTGRSLSDYTYQWQHPTRRNHRFSVTTKTVENVVTALMREIKEHTGYAIDGTGSSSKVENWMPDMSFEEGQLWRFTADKVVKDVPEVIAKGGLEAMYPFGL